MNRATQQDQYRKIILAIQKYLTSVTTITLAGTAFTPAQLVSFYTNLIALADAALAARAVYASAVKANDQGIAQSETVQHAFKSLVLSMFAGQEGPLADFTFAPRKVATLTAAQKATAAAKRKATRAARHTMGKNQKKAVTGATTPPDTTSTGGTATAAPGVSGTSTPKTA